MAASTDKGDLSPDTSLTPTSGGFRDTNHSNDFRIVDEEMASVVPAKANGDDGK